MGIYTGNSGRSVQNVRKPKSLYPKIEGNYCFLRPLCHNSEGNYSVYPVPCVSSNGLYSLLRSVTLSWDLNNLLTQTDVLKLNVIKHLLRSLFTTPRVITQFNSRPLFPNSENNHSLLRPHFRIRGLLHSLTQTSLAKY